MTEVMKSNSSYLDLEDPFHTTTSTQSKNKTACNFDGVLEYTEEACERSFMNVKVNEKPPPNQITPPREEDEDNDDILQECHPSAREIIDAPSEWDFSKYNALDTTSFCSQKSLGSLPDALRERTESIMFTDVNADTLTEQNLRTLVTVAARLLSEHDLLLNSRNKLLESMQKMHQSEKDAAMQLISLLNVDSVDEKSRKIILELSTKLGTFTTPNTDELLVQTPDYELKNSSDVVTPRSNHDSEESTTPKELERLTPSLFSVPPPDPSRPPPGFISEPNIVEPSMHLNSRQLDMSTTPPPVPPSILQCTPNSAPPGPFCPRFPSMLDHPSVMSPAVPMFTHAPPMMMGAPMHRPHQFILPGRPRGAMMLSGTIPKSGLAHMTPVGNHHYRRRFSTGSRGRGGSAYRK